MREQTARTISGPLTSRLYSGSVQCDPSSPRRQCLECARMAPARPPEAGKRSYVVVDATVLKWPEDQCPMWVSR